MDVSGQLHGLAALTHGEGLRYPSKKNRLFGSQRESENVQKIEKCLSSSGNRNHDLSVVQLEQSRYKDSPPPAHKHSVRG